MSAASVSQWRAQAGHAQPKTLGGDCRSRRIEAQSETILAILEEEHDITVEGLRRRLTEKGLIFGEGAIRRFFTRHGIMRKKDDARIRAGPLRRPEAASGLVR